MPGNKEGAKKAAETRRQKYGQEYYAKIGALGGTQSKGRKHSVATKRKISQSLRKRHENS